MVYWEGEGGKVGGGIRSTPRRKPEPSATRRGTIGMHPRIGGRWWKEEDEKGEKEREREKGLTLSSSSHSSPGLASVYTHTHTCIYAN